VNLPLQLYLGAWRAARRYFRYETTGLENLDIGRAGLIVGYHGRPYAYDLLMLLVEIYERQGYMPHGVIHGAVESNAVFKWLSDELGFVTGDGPAIDRAVAQGEHIVVVPGGTREGCRSIRERYRVDWGQRVGYLKLALRHRLPVIPVAATGVDHAYIGLNDGYRLGKRVKMPARLPLWFGLGPTGFWPFSPPFPVKVRQRIGAPIDLEADGPIDRDDRDSLLRCHRRITGAVQGLLDELNRTRMV
jgi:1-acyl-sn-glycerol-3-phosphate acyltransferase